MASKRSVQERGAARAGLEFALLVTLFLVSLGVRWLYVRAVVFPPSDSAAFHLTAASNVVSGRGLEVDVLGSYQVALPHVTHASHEHWMPLTTGLIAAAFAIQRAVTGVLETSLQLGQMPGLILGALLAPLTYRFGRRALPQGPGNRWVSFGAALLVAVNVTLCHQTASADASAPFVLLAAGALTIAVRRPGEPGGYLGAGLLVALAYLTMTDALLLLVAIPLAWWLLPLPSRPPSTLPDGPAARLVWEQWARQSQDKGDEPGPVGPGLRHVIDLVVAFALIVTAWLVRNYLTFGTPLPGASLSVLWLTDYADTFNYLSHPTLEGWIAQPWAVLVDQRIQALTYVGRVLLVGTFPWGVLAVPGMWLLRREPVFFPSFVYFSLLALGVALVLPISAMSGTFYHAFGAVVPFLALAALHTIERAASLLRRRGKLASFALISAIIGLMLLAGWQVARTLPEARKLHLADKDQFEAVAAWLQGNAGPGDVIMTTQPYLLNYASGHPAIVLPGSEPPDAAWQAAQHYHARYLIVMEDLGLYPGVLDAQPDPRFKPVAEIQGSRIYQVAGGQP